MTVWRLDKISRQDRCNSESNKMFGIFWFQVVSWVGRTALLKAPKFPEDIGRKESPNIKVSDFCACSIPHVQSSFLQLRYTTTDGLSSRFPMADVARILGSADAFAVLELPKAPVAVAEVRSHYRRVMDDCDDCGHCGQETPKINDWNPRMEVWFRSLL